MKKVKLGKLFALLAMSMTLVFTTSCEKSDVDDINPIVGVWTLDTNTYSLTIDGVSYVDILIAEYGYTQEDAEAYAAIPVPDQVEMTFEFKEGGAFVFNMDGDEGTGTWTLIGDVLSITYYNYNIPSVFDVTALNASTLVMESSSSDNLDFDGDGTEEVIVYNYRQAFTR